MLSYLHNNLTNSMSSYLNDKNQGMVYNNKRNFAVTNWSDEDIKVNWADPGLNGTGDNFYTLHAGETKTYPMYLAYYITEQFVDREMYKSANKIPNNPDGSASKQRERAEFAVANPDLRKPYEDKTMQEVIEGQESPEVTAMRAEIRKKLIQEGKIEGGTGNLVSELSLNPDGSEKEEKEEFATLPKKRGRPAKSAAEAAAAV